MPVVLFALLTGAGLAAGLSGTIAGLASLFSYPALLAAGLPPVAANVTNTVSLAAGCITVVPGSRRELAGQAAAARELGIATALGAVAGAALLLATPPGVFQRLVPFLIAIGSAVIMARRPAQDTADHDDPPLAGRRRWLVFTGVFAVSVYSGYFAAASGVLLLAWLIATTSGSLLRINALKNVLILVADIIAAAGFAAFGPVSWTAVLPLTIGLLAGSWLGPRVARWLPADLLRVGIALAGLALAVKLGIDAF